MLHEIFKGMDNAAEQINENFEKLEPETGKNEQGSYIKHPDGKLECKTTLTIDSNISTAFGELFRSAAKTWDFPVEFIEPPLINGWVTTGNYKWIVKVGSATTTSIGIAIASANRDYESPYNVILKAEGRWKE